VHLPDLPLAGNDSLKVGLGLWRHVGASVVLELLILGLGLALYTRGRSRRHPLRPIRLAVLLVPLVGGYVASLAGPPPTSIPVLGVSVVVLLLAAGAIAAWADRAATSAELAASHPPR
jgi:hypothetical protein